MHPFAASVAFLTAVALSGAAHAGPIPGEFIIDPNLPGQTHYDGWLAIENDGIWQPSLSVIHSPVGVSYPGSGAWSSAIASKQGSTGHDAQIVKVANGVGGGPFTSSTSLYFGGFSPTANTFGGTVAVSDTTPLGDLKNIVLQVEIGEADGYDFWEGPSSHLPVLSYNGGSQAIEAASWEITHQVQTGTYDAPEVGEQPIYQNTFLLQWDLSGVVETITDFQIAITAAQHAQIYAMRLDQSDSFAPIPEPASLGLLAGSAMLLLGRNRRRT